MPTAMAPAATRLPDGPWAGYADVWARVFPQLGGDEIPTAIDELWDHAAADPETRELMRATVERAVTGSEEEEHGPV